MRKRKGRKNLLLYVGQEIQLRFCLSSLYSLFLFFRVSVSVCLYGLSIIIFVFAYDDLTLTCMQQRPELARRLLVPSLSVRIITQLRLEADKRTQKR